MITKTTEKMILCCDCPGCQWCASWSIPPTDRPHGPSCSREALGAWEHPAWDHTPQELREWAANPGFIDPWFHKLGLDFCASCTTTARNA